MAPAPLESWSCVLDLVTARKCVEGDVYQWSVSCLPALPLCACYDVFSYVPVVANL